MMKMLPKPANCEVAGPAYVSPSRMFLSSSFTSSYPGGTIISTTYLPAGSIGVLGSVGSATQIVQFVPANELGVPFTPATTPGGVAGMPEEGFLPMMLGNWYMPSYGAGCNWFHMCMP